MRLTPHVYLFSVPPYTAINCQYVVTNRNYINFDYLKCIYWTIINTARQVIQKYSCILLENFADVEFLISIFFSSVRTKKAHESILRFLHNK